MKTTRKALLVLISAAVLVLGSVFVTYAYLTDSESVTNTFTVGNINITLTESNDLDLGMVPGVEIDKDPVVTVKAGSEDCWLFIKVEESENLDDYIVYEIDQNNWTKLENSNNVYYSYADEIVNDRRIKVLDSGTYTDPMDPNNKSDDVTVSWSNQQVCTKPSVTKEMMDDLEKEGAIQPKLTFTAYAVQKAGFNTAAEAWTAIPQDNN